MKFVNTEENEKLIKRLDDAVKNDRISHAYIFEGSECIDKRNFAEAFIKGILCPLNAGDGCGRCSMCDKVDHGNHEDIIYVSSEEKSIKDADIVSMQERLKIKPFGDRHMVIVERADTMTLRAQNRLLKTLEEPPGKTVMILLSENMENLTPTIQSRCVKYRINYFGSKSYEKMLERAEDIAEMSLKRKEFYKVKKAVDEAAGNREDVNGFLDGMQIVFRNMLVKEEKGISLYKEEDIIDGIHAVENARKQIREGVSPTYAVRNLMIKLEDRA